ncbi:MAG TPA: ATP-binding protein [Jatrophihabitans sp.]|uniref:ATP-binding protein n=1 Tax=Jatrophihabitans sp. TaxID=1932789 RepID=UPI002E0CB49B|nr:ATP-binding protein [Jatrophihabitans sp.]
MGRGTLRIYLGAAPGVGKTVAMLDEGARRLARGTDVVVAFAETHGRIHTAECLAALPAVARKAVRYRDAAFEEMDLDAVLARRPKVALVDELAHTNVPGSGRHERRWQDVEELLEAGIDVITTLNIQHLESLNDVVQEITGVAQRETVPDSVVRAADQVEVVDMAPEALRRRMAHGNIYPSERIDAALGNYFRVGNLTALRELALLWLADSVEEGLQRYRTEHGITDTWETKERIVVGLTGGPEGETLVRRASRIAARTAGGELLAVHIVRSDGLAGPGVAALTGQRLLVESLGGTYHSVIGDDVPSALLQFARSVDATQIVLGTSRRGGLAAAVTGPGTGATVTRLSGPIDVHLVSHDHAGGAGLRLPRLTGGLTPRRRLSGLLVAAVLLPALTVLCTAARSSLDFATDVPLYLLAVVITSLVGGFYPALASAVAASLLLNYFFVAPTHTFTISEPSNLVAVITFLLIAVLVSQVVDLAARRSVQAARAGAEAETLSTFAGSLLRGEQALPALIERVRETFAMNSASLLRHDETTRSWISEAAAGSAPPRTPAEADATTSVDDLELALRGHALTAGDQRVLGAIAAHLAVAYRQQRLAEAAHAAEPLAESDRQRTALLNAVSHDLRTPIAAAKAAVSSLRASEVTWNEAERRELLGTAEDALDRLTELVTNLLDLSRLQVGALPVVPGVVGVDDVVARALDHVAPDRHIEVDVPADLPEVRADAGLLERVIANVVQNAIRHTPPDSPIRIAGSSHQQRVELRVIDRGPGISAEDADAVFRPFQRTDDSHASGDGVGLGLAIARGFTEAMGGEVGTEPTPGGGATFVITLEAAT